MLLETIAPTTSCTCSVVNCSIKSDASPFFNALSVASKSIRWSAPAIVTSDKPETAPAAKLPALFIVVWLCTITSMPEPFGGAVENVSVVPLTEYVFLNWYTPSIYTCVLFSCVGSTFSVKVVSEPSPLKLLIVSPSPCTAADTVCTVSTLPATGASAMVNVVPLTLYAAWF